MLKYGLTFLAGMLACFFCVWYSAGQTAVSGFILGAVFTLGLQFALCLSSPARLSRAAAFLAALARALQDASPSIPAAGARRATPSQTPVAAIEEEIVSALCNFGAPRKRAEQAARAAAEENPGGTFEQMFRSALQGIKK